MKILPKFPQIQFSLKSEKVLKSFQFSLFEEYVDFFEGFDYKCEK